ncbi:CxC2 domain-containing protein [Mycena chlorophos]|uniref:CxC2 domain-containing protein n=1 Tax=Mycena chlorophos TaxID=658473 RepID=A0A8H6SSB9_MYCCL|nr:CxC2 domain-containing protein [Mycena chlorophos]
MSRGAKRRLAELAELESNIESFVVIPAPPTPAPLPSLPSVKTTTASAEPAPKPPPPLKAPRLHSIDSVLQHRPEGNLLVWCPACPEPGFNSDPNCPQTPYELRQDTLINHHGDWNFKKMAALALAPAPDEDSDSGTEDDTETPMEVDESMAESIMTEVTAIGTQVDRHPRAKKRRTQPKPAAAKADERPSGWIWQLGKFAKMNDAEMDAWSHEGDRVQWFRAEAEMQRWREQREQKIAELLRTRRSFLRMAQTWNTLADLNAEKPGYSAYGHQKAAMFTRMAREVEERIKEAGYGELLAPDAKLVDWVMKKRAVEDTEFERLVYQN